MFSEIFLFFPNKIFKIQKPDTLYISDIPSLCADVALFIYLYLQDPFNERLVLEIHNIRSYSQTQLSIMSLIKSTHLATGFDQT